MALIRRLRALHPSIAGRPPATLHGDLHIKNFIVSVAGVALIDLDTLAAGDPLEDVASFTAALYSAGLADNVPERENELRVKSFVSAYERLSGWSIRTLDLNWHIAAALTTERAFRAVTRMKPDLPPTEVLMNLAARFVARAEQAAAGVGVLA
jgi:aminoglycoside phosphotransferase (APT) family kinase protein